MKKKKLYIFNKEILIKTIVIVLLFISLGLFCFIDNKVNAFSDDIVNVDNVSYPIFTYDSFLLRSNEMSDTYISLPISNEVFQTLNTSTFNTFECDLGVYRFNIPTPQQYRITMQDGPPISEIILFSSYMYIPSNFTDYYVTFDKLFLGTSLSFSNNSTCNINLRYKLQTTDINEVVDDTISYNMNMLFADGFDVFNWLDLSGLVFDNGCFITDYYLSLTFSEDVPLTYFEISRQGVIELPTEPIIPSLEVSQTCPTDIDLNDFLTSSIGGFMDFQLFPGFSIAGMLSTILAVGLFILFLKVFAGG